MPPQLIELQGIGQSERGRAPQEKKKLFRCRCLLCQVNPLSWDSYLLLCYLQAGSWSWYFSPSHWNLGTKALPHLQGWVSHFQSPYSELMTSGISQWKKGQKGHFNSFYTLVFIHEEAREEAHLCEFPASRTQNPGFDLQHHMPWLLTSCIATIPVFRR